MDFKHIQLEAQTILNIAVANGEETGAQFAVVQHGEVVVNAYAGFLEPEKKRLVTDTSLFPIYSTGKSMASSAFLRLVERGTINLGTRVGDIWPEFACNGKETATVRHILMHRSGICKRPHYDFIEQITDWPVMIARIAAHQAAFVPGTQCRYQTVNYGWLLAELAQRTDGRPFKQILQEEIIDFIGLKNLYFGVPTSELDRVATVFRAPCMGQPPANPPCWDYSLDEIMNTRVIQQDCLAGFNCISNAIDLARHGDALIDFDSPRHPLSPEMIREATTMTLCIDDPKPESPASWCTHGLGFKCRRPIGDDAQIFGHAGYGGAESISVKPLHLGVGYTCNALGNARTRAKLYRLLNLN